jgi:DNA-binding winged helix-turn-helix (wHTH) protein
VLPLGDRALDILIYLAQRPGKVIAKQELFDHVWPDVTVEKGSLWVHVAATRKALRDGQCGNRYIANAKGRGYSFVGSLVRFEDSTEHASDWHMKARLCGASVSPNTYRRSSKLRSFVCAEPPSAQGRLLALLKHANWLESCPLIGEERKCVADRQHGAFDPLRKCRFEGRAPYTFVSFRGPFGCRRLPTFN